jgi:hypothetical protein
LINHLSKIFFLLIKGLTLGHIRLLESNVENPPMFEVDVGPEEYVYLNAIESLKLRDSLRINDLCYKMLTNSRAFKARKLHSVRKLRDKFKQAYEIKTKPNGVFLAVKDKLNKLLPLIYKKINQEENPTDTFYLKFCLDSAEICRNYTILNFNFAVLNEKAKSKTSFGHYTLGLFRINKENYSSVFQCSSDIFDEIDEINEIEFQGKKFKIEKYLGGDWKILAILAGLSSANSNFPCLHCKCEKRELYDFNKEWSITDKNKGARTHEESEECIKKLRVDERIGYINNPICKFPFSRFIVDMLHLKLRITDKLNEHFFERILEYSADRRDYVNEINEEIKCPLVGRFNDFLVKTCGIQNPIYKSGTIYKIRDFRGGEQTRMYNKMCEKNHQGEYIFSLENIFPVSIDQINEIDKLYKDFYKTYIDVKEKRIEPQQVKTQSHNWLDNYAKIYTTMRVTPYMHSFAQHLHEFQSIYENVNDFNQEGHEKFNDMCKRYYFGSTNKQTSQNKYLKQIFHKFNRKELLDLDFSCEDL